MTYFTERILHLTTKNECLLSPKARVGRARRSSRRIPLYYRIEHVCMQILFPKSARWKPALEVLSAEAGPKQLLGRLDNISLNTRTHYLIVYRQNYYNLHFSKRNYHFLYTRDSAKFVHGFR